MADVFLLTGLSGAGKTTLAHAIVERFAGMEKSVVLDGDEMRSGLCKDLGFSSEDRLENIRRCAEVAKLLADQEVTVFIAVIAPYESLRNQIKAIVGKHRLYVVHISCPLEECIRRDPKCNYKKALKGVLKNYTGIEDNYELPSKPDLVIPTHEFSVEKSINMLESFVLARKKSRQVAHAD